MQSQFNSVFVGLDVSKSFIDVCVLGPFRPRRWRVRQEPAALSELAAELAALEPERIVVEATGKYELAIVDALAALAAPVVVMNPKRVRDFARSQGILAKTDKLDAYVLALYGAQIQPALRALPSREQRELAALTAYQQKTVADRAALRIQLQCAGHDVIAASLLRRIEQLDVECRLIEAEIDNRIAASPLWFERAQLARTAPGVGVQTARTLVAEMPELGQLEDREAAALAGLAPFASDSGEHYGRRRIRGGRKRVRRMLYMAARTAVRVDVGYGEKYQKLQARGKAKNAALIAIARTLLVALNHMIRDGKPFESRFDA
jgi:transposase